MSGIFLSYSRADRPTAQRIAEALQAEGFTVWWDKVLRAGETYDEVTERMLRVSNVVVVLWSQTSVKSKWVRAEATLGQRNAVVIPAMIEDAERPIMFELTQTADLIGWDGDHSNEQWQGFVADIRRVIDEAEPEGPAEADTSAELPPSSPPTPDATIENTYWLSIQDTKDPAELESYLKRYPDGHFSDLAKSRLSALMATADPSAPTPAPAPETAPVRAPEPTPVRSESAAPAASEPRSGSKLPLILVAALIGLGLVGWGAMQVLPKSATAADSSEAVETAEVTPTTCENCPDLVRVPAGSFMIGSPDGEYARVGNEGPQVEISIAAFDMSRTEITKAQWDACVEDGGCRTDGGGEARHPVVSVSWDDANAYARWLSNKTGRAFRLPTEAEWEYAARAGTATPYWWGERYDRSKTVSGGAADAASLPENPFGLAGMLGNVREWVEDCYVNSYADADATGRAMQGGNCNLRVVRGGSFKEGAAEHRSANRARMSKGTRDSSLGFRVVAPAGEGG